MADKTERKLCPKPSAKSLLIQVISACNFVGRAVIARLRGKIHHSLINYHCGSLPVRIKTGNLKTVAICSSNPAESCSFLSRGKRAYPSVVFGDAANHIQIGRASCRD